MKVTQEKLPDSQLGLEIEISGESSREKYDKTLQNLARSTSIPGFRKGKVPKHILLQRLGVERIKAAVLEELIQEGIQEAIASEEIQSLGQFKLRSNFEELVQQYQPGESITFSAAVDVPPQVEVADYQNITVKVEEIPYDSETVETILTERRAEKATLVPVEGRGAQLGDLALIDYQGKENSEIISGVEGKDFSMELIAANFIPGFVEGIVGMNLEESKSLPLTFPEDYPREDLAGKAVVFEVTLKELKEKELPELDDDFAQEVSEFETIAELRESLEKQYREKAEQEQESACNTAILADLVERTSVELPETMIEQEIDQILTQTALQIQEMGVDIKQFFTPESIPKLRENARPEAIRKIKEGLIIEAIAKQESINPEETEINSRIEEVKTKLEGQNIDLERLKTLVFDDILTEKTLSRLRGKATVELVPKGSLTQEAETEQE
ncbi:trigger factor [Gloeocapsa sp. PCC 73106]|uniref:trigger factor n=1 Tax=Gloeocapsa sp. PCC 73106 TaxID=102232 RepID=UPI0002ACD027|nr:trigger factor [Gloeocapsa sp. PCC 73106]ELR99749.1 trigger factor [Gloeocapsa sp. PCC 73106]